MLGTMMTVFVTYTKKERKTVLTYIITCITDCSRPISLTLILLIMSVSTLTTVFILYTGISENRGEIQNLIFRQILSKCLVEKS
jgi:hypothetical protein